MQYTNRHGVVTISYTSLGAQLQEKLRNVFQAIEPDAEVYAYGNRKANEYTHDVGTIATFDKTEDILDQHFDKAELIVFISAAGIAVRKIAPYLKNKTTDPAVVCMDEGGKFVIPLVSGHLGGANAWAQKIAERIGATAVITTATDGRGIFAVDLFAKENGLLIEDSSKIKEVSARLLAGERVGICSDVAIGGKVPEGLVYCRTECVIEESSGARPECGITITEDSNLPQQFKVECRLLPKNLVLGIGCRRGTNAGKLESFVLDILKQNGLDVRRVCAVTSIDIKKEETAIVALAKHLGVPFAVYSAEQLKACKGEFSASAFVEAQVGVDNVCERSAICTAEEFENTNSKRNAPDQGTQSDPERIAGERTRLVLKKTVGEGMTLAVAKINFVRK